MTGPAADPKVQDAVRRFGQRLDDLRSARWEQLLRAAWGRELVYELIFERGRAMAPSFEPAIKDGMCAALHAARNEGVREFALDLLEALNGAFPDLMLQMHLEMTAARQAERAQRQQAQARAATTED